MTSTTTIAASYARGFRDGLAAARKREQHANPILSAGPVTLDRDNETVTAFGREIVLTHCQRAALENLLLHKHKRLRAGTLSNSGGVMVWNLRKRLRAAGVPEDFILSGQGYRINPAYS